MDNSRRLFLIQKKYREGLSEAEIVQLAALQEQMGRHLDEIAPLPDEILERLESLADRLEGGEKE
jgi:hypothetical protein